MSWRGVLGIGAALIVAELVYLGWYVRWEARRTRGLAYYGRPLAERRAIKRRIRWLSLPAMPFVRLLALAGRNRTPIPTFEYQGVSGPPKVSSPEIFAHAQRYQPRPEDVFVVTQMRCGTTWMQQLVYEIVSRGNGDLTDAGHGHMYALSPWIDAANSVSMEAAPLVGDKPTRIIKSHLPASLCPYSPAAKYIYVTRHPVSCFASIVDYNRALQGPFVPSVSMMADWFCSDRMYWLPWPAHVAGWWEWASQRENVLFVHFEEMKSDFAAVLDRVAGFLGYALTADEKQRIAVKCSFKYMQDHEDWFEMSPPTMFSVSGGRFLASGQASRDADVTPEVRARVREFCRAGLAGAAYPVERFYPDLIQPEGRLPA
jgi:sulfotransferase family protein